MSPIPALDNLLQTKFHQPALPARRVSRPHLVARLEEGLRAGRVVSLISAPAGYGKSSLAIEWSRQTSRPYAWLQLDEGDNDPARFFLYFIAALQKVQPDFGAEVAVSLAAGQLPAQDILAGLLADDLLRAPRPLLLFLDDLQVIHETAVFNGLQALVSRVPEKLHLAVLTREDPSFPLARLRAQNLLTEIRAADLRFSTAEIQDFYRAVIPLELSADDLAVLEKRTEGWAAGLQLAGLSMQGREDLHAFIQSLNGSHRFILGYLTEEVLHRQPEYIQDFLLKTSILKQLNGSLCDALTGRSDSAELLEELLAANLFLIPLDDSGQWYRYHGLFSELLFSLLKRSQGEQINEYHQRASRWLSEHGRALDAVDHSLAAGDYARAIELMEENILSMLGGGHLWRVDGWIRALPPEWLGRSVKINLGFAWVYLLRSNFERVAFHFGQARSALESQPETPGAEKLRAEILALEANFLQTQGKVKEAIAAGQEALRLADAGDFRLRGLASLALGGALRQADQFDQAVETLQEAIRLTQESKDFVTGMLSTGQLVLMALDFGRLRLAAEAAERSLRWLEDSPTAPPPIIGVIFSTLGMVGLERGQMETAREYMQRGLKLARFSGHNASIISIQTNMARLHLYERDFEQAKICLDEAWRLFIAGAAGWLRPGLIARQAQYELARGDAAAAEAVLRENGILPEGEVRLPAGEAYLVWVRLLAAHGEAGIEQGLALTRRIIERAQTVKRSSLVMLANLHQALLLESADRRDEALFSLRAALELAEPEGFIQPFLEAGGPIASLLVDCGDLPYARRVQSAFAAIPTASSAAGVRSPLPEPLTERELEVLRLLAEGLSYAEVAEHLVVSLNTVRYHVKGLYGKLGVDRQTRAVEMARKLGLL